MKDFNVTVIFSTGMYSHTMNLKAEDEKQAINKAVNDHFIGDVKILSVTVVEKEAN